MDACHEQEREDGGLRSKAARPFFGTMQAVALSSLEDFPMWQTGSGCCANCRRVMTDVGKAVVKAGQVVYVCVVCAVILAWGEAHPTETAIKIEPPPPTINASGAIQVGPIDLGLFQSGKSFLGSG
jgi:hypothetical protein